MKNYKKIITLILTITFFFILLENSALMAKRTKAETEEYLDKVEFGVIKLKDSDADINSHSKDIMMEIMSYINQSKEYLNKRKYDMSYYSAKIAEEYIELIKARIKLQDAISEYNDATGNTEK